ncbi:MAG: L-threonylcarbamoyladenylate synthase type 1 TsaC, partial [Thermoplasmata archaeon]
MAQVLKASEENLEIAAEVIRKGGLVAFPTETVYGLGADAFNPDAVARIFEVKERPSFDPIIVHIADFKDIRRLCRKVDERAKILAER